MAKIKILDLPSDQKISKAEMKRVLGGKGSTLDFSFFSTAAYKSPDIYGQTPPQPRPRYRDWDKSSGRNSGIDSL